jgi:hypothetical protein
LKLLPSALRSRLIVIDGAPVQVTFQSKLLAEDCFVPLKYSIEIGRRPAFGLIKNSEKLEFVISK